VVDLLHRVVPIEIGQHYLTPDWSQQLMKLSEFIECHIECSTTDQASNVGYLAQTPLFDQIEALRADIGIPEYCSICDIGNEDDLVINAWFVCSTKATPRSLHDADALHMMALAAVQRLKGSQRNRHALPL
jgi:[histone H3]-dimethyl/trimethyl-L-lysine36 demethylase